MNRLRPALSWLVAAAIGLVAVAPAEAGSIKIFDGSETLVITDEDFISEPGTPADGAVGPGVVVFMGSLGIWTFQLTSGVSTPVVGSQTEPIMELHDVSLSSKGSAGTLEIWFSETGFGPSGLVAESSIGGVADGKIKYETFKGTTLFDDSVALSSMTASAGPFGGLGYAGVGDATGPFSLTQKVTITHKGGSDAKLTSFDARLAVSPGASVPEGGMTLSLLGLALMGLAGFRHALSNSRD